MKHLASSILTSISAGAVLSGLLKQHPDWTFSALVRNEKHFEAVRSVGVAVVPGSFTDKSLISDQSYSADIVINTADCDDIPLTEAILAGMRKRFQEGKPKGILIHTSGTAVLTDGKREGKFDPQGKIWNVSCPFGSSSRAGSLRCAGYQRGRHSGHHSRDASRPSRRTVSCTFSSSTTKSDQLVQNSILKAAGEGYLNAYILCPGAILGPPTGPIKTATTIFLKFFLSALSGFKSAVYVGEGTGEFTFVHLDDLVDLYLRVVDTAVSGKDAGASPYARYFFVVSRGVAWKDIAAAVAIALHKRGRLDDATPISVSVKDDSHPYGVAPFSFGQ